MISLVLRNLSRMPGGTPRQFRLMLIVFTVRHLLGFAVFGWLLWQAIHVGGAVPLVIGSAAAIYVAVAVFNWYKLLQGYLRSRQIAAAAGSRL